MYQRLIRTTLVLGAACLLAACGFQLRGTGGGVEVPDDWRYMYLVTNTPNRELSRAVRTGFAANGVEWQEKEQANYRVILGPERFSQRNLSLNADARAAEFELTMRSTFSVTDNKGETVMPQTTASVVKQMENEPQNVGGKSEEIRILKAEMRRELAQQIMRRIAFFAASQQP